MHKFEKKNISYILERREYILASKMSTEQTIILVMSEGGNISRQKEATDLNKRSFSNAIPNYAWCCISCVAIEWASSVIIFNPIPYMSQTNKNQLEVNIDHNIPKGTCGFT